MKKYILYTFVMSVFAMPVGATSVDSDYLAFPEDVAQAQQENGNDIFLPASGIEVAEVDTHKVKQRNFSSRRSYKNRKLIDKEDYPENAEWVGATQVVNDGQKMEAIKRLNRRFVSKRAYRHYRDDQ